MPNHCYHRLTLSGPLDVIEELFDYIKNPNPMPQGVGNNLFCFQKIIPMPAELESTSYPPAPSMSLHGRFGFDNWYEWRIENWGTKWEPFDVERKSHDVLFFSTAWSPARPIYRKMAEQFPDLEFEIHYLDEGGDFAGSMHLAEGQEQSDSESSVSDDIATIAREIFEMDYGYLEDSTELDYENTNTTKYNGYCSEEFVSGDYIVVSEDPYTGEIDRAKYACQVDLISGRVYGVEQTDLGERRLVDSYVQYTDTCGEIKRMENNEIQLVS